VKIERSFELLCASSDFGLSNFLELIPEGTGIICGEAERLGFRDCSAGDQVDQRTIELVTVYNQDLFEPVVGDALRDV
jgi:hypothetical protein